MSEVEELKSRFSYSPTDQIVGEVVEFTDESSGAVATWEWNFGDESAVSNDQNPVHVYDDPGEYEVSLKVTDGAQEEDNSDQILSIQKKYRVSGAWVIPDLRADITILEYEAGNRTTGKRWRLPFDHQKKDYEEFARRVKAAINSTPTLGPNGETTEAIEDAIHIEVGD